MPIQTGAMGIPFRKRLGLVDRNAETRTDRGVMARTLMYPYAVGGTLALAAAGGDAARLGAIAGVCWVVTALLLATYDAMPDWSFPALTALGAALLLWAVQSHAGAAHACAPLLALPATYAMFFLRKLAALSITALAAGGYMVVALTGPGLPWSQVAVAAIGIAAA